MDSCEIENCLTPFNDGFVSINAFVTNAFKTGFLLIGYFSDCFYDLSLAVKILASIQIVFMLYAFINLLIMKLKNSNRISLFTDSSQNVIPWLCSTYITLIFIVWVALVASIQIAFDLAWLSSVSTTLIVWHVWVEFPLAVIGITLLVRSEMTWKQLFKFFLILYSGFLLNSFMVSLTSNSYIQGSLGMLAFLSDFVNPIVYAILTHRVKNYVDKVRMGLMESVFISHLLTFYLPVIFCFDPFIMAVLYVSFQALNIILTFTYVIYELRNHRNISIPSIF